MMAATGRKSVPSPLGASELTALATTVPGWFVDHGVLIRTLTADSFLGALELVVQIGHVAEASNHHPDINIAWRTVTLRTTTHDAGNVVTARDLHLARAINRLVDKAGLATEAHESHS